MSRTFTLREAAGLLELVGPGADLPDRNPADRARELVRRLAAARSLRPGSSADDILDPIGQAADVHTSVGAAVADALLPVLDRLAAVASVAVPVGTSHRPV
jgi:protein-tyrosine phosphatase